MSKYITKDILIWLSGVITLVASVLMDNSLLLVISAYFAAWSLLRDLSKNITWQKVNNITTKNVYIAKEEDE